VNLTPAVTTRLLWVSVLMCMAALIVLGLTIWRVDTNSEKADRALVEQNRLAIIDGCLEVEKLRGVVREIMEAVIRFNIESGTAEALRRAEAYQHIVETRLGAAECNP
jgi:hypothetical protein